MNKKTIIVTAASAAAVVALAAGTVWAVTGLNAEPEKEPKPTAVATIPATPTAPATAATPPAPTPGGDEPPETNGDDKDIIIDEEAERIAKDFIREYGTYSTEETDDERRARLSKFNVAPEVLDQALPVQLTFADLNYSEAVITSAPDGELNVGYSGQEVAPGTYPRWVGGFWITKMTVGGTEQIAGGNLAWDIVVTGGPERKILAVEFTPAPAAFQ